MCGVGSDVGQYAYYIPVYWNKSNMSPVKKFMRKYFLH